jgi:spore germination protein PD
MDYTVINGELTVANIKIRFVGTASTVIVGDIRTIDLSNAFEGPPEELIVGVTLPTLPADIPITG